MTTEDKALNERLARLMGWELRPGPGELWTLNGGAGWTAHPDGSERTDPYPRVDCWGVPDFAGNPHYLPHMVAWLVDERVPFCVGSAPAQTVPMVPYAHVDGWLISVDNEAPAETTENGLCRALAEALDTWAEREGKHG